MRFSIPQPQFLKHLQLVERAVNERSPLPILANVLLETRNQDLCFTATDLDLGVQCRFPLTQPIEQGAVALPARKLTTIIRELPDEVVMVEAKKNHTATLSCGTTSFRLPGLPAEDFPILPATHDGATATLPQGALKALVEQTAYAMSLEETRFILNGALFAAEKSTLTMVATDGRRLAVSSATLSEPTRQPFQAVIPSKTVRELGRVLSTEEMDAVAITMLKDNQLAFRFGSVTVITRLLEGQFPPYEKVIPAPSKHVLTCQLQALASAVRRVSLMTTAASQAVVFEVGPERLIVSKESAELGSAREEIPAAFPGEPMTIAFNPEFWLDVFKVLSGDELRLELSGPERPAAIRHPGLTYVVLPMKLA